ncbi:hypothetical protein [Aurantibacter sp.]
MLGNLKTDSIDMSGNVARNTRALKSAEAIQKQLENRIPWSDTMATH